MPADKIAVFLDFFSWGKFDPVGPLRSDTGINDENSALSHGIRCHQGVVGRVEGTIAKV